MNRWTQRARGAIGIGLTWATGWAPIGAVAGALTAVALDFPLGIVARNYAVMFGAMGFVGGAIFSSLLSLTERRRSFGELSIPRFTLWGAIGGLALGAIAVGVGLLGAGLSTLGAAMVGAATLLGTGSAAGTLAIARRSPHAVALPSGEEESPRRAVATSEARESLGKPT